MTVVDRARSKQILANVSLEVASGETVALVGESGSGKSTLGLALLGLTRGRGGILSGSVAFDGHQLLGLDESEWREYRGKRIGFITQSPRGAFNPVVPVGHQIALHYKEHCGATKEDARAVAIESLRTVAIGDPVRRYDSYPHELSGGMAQRALIAMAIATKPTFLIADEPTTALDVTTQAQILDLLADLCSSNGMAMLLITHDLGVVANYCDRVVLMNGGEVMEVAPVNLFFENPRHPATIATLASQGGSPHTGKFRLESPREGEPVQATGCPLVTRCQFAQEVAGCARNRPMLLPVETDHLSRCHRAYELGQVRDAMLATGGSGTSSVRGQQSKVRGVIEPSARNLLSVRKVSKTFRVRGTRKLLTACDDISLDLHRGETLGIVGETGSGKTTLGRLILALIPPSSGEIDFDGENLNHLSRPQLRRLRRKVQIVFQDPAEALDPKMRIGMQVTESLRSSSALGRADRVKRARELLTMVGLPKDVADELPRALSIGMQQRVCVARAIASGPDLLVLDEPTSALPPETKADIMELLGHLRGELGLAYVLITHDLSLVSEFCDLVAVMYLGQIVESGPSLDVLSRPRHPYSKALVGSMLRRDPRSPRRHAQGDAELSGDIPSAVDLPLGCHLASRCPEVEPRCHQEVQHLAVAGDGHMVRCWRSTTSPEQGVSP